MSSTDSTLVSRVWDMAHVLRDQGIGCGAYAGENVFQLVL